jgi:uncharacterized DUF497 family protein
MEVITLESLLDAEPDISYGPKTTYKDSYEALYDVERGDPNHHIEVIDRIVGTTTLLRFIWNRKKSNENFKDRGDGKGFSFYFARYAYRDRNKVECPELARDPANTSYLALIEKDGEDILFVVQAKKIDTQGRIRIVSAYHRNDGRAWSIYHRNAMKQKGIQDYTNRILVCEGDEPDFLEKVTQEYRQRILAWEEAQKNI